MIGAILLCTYLALAGTIGAWWMASKWHTDENGEVSLLDILANVIPAMMLCWFFALAYVLERIKIKKFK